MPKWISKACALVLPPIIPKLWCRIWNQSTRLQYFSGAWEDCPCNQDVDGWNAEKVVQTERAKWTAFCRNLESTGPLGFSHEHHDLSMVDSPYLHNIHMTFAYVLALTAQRRKQVSVLDYGGALGHYCLLARAVLPDVSLDYHVKEVPRMVAIGKKLNPMVYWHADDECLNGQYDLVLVNSSLQYLQHWHAILEKLCKATKGYFLLMRIHVVENSSSFLAIQQAHGSQMICWQFNRKELLKIVADSQLVLMREMVCGDPVPIQGAPENAVLRGWLFRKPDGQNKNRVDNRAATQS